MPLDQSVEQHLVTVLQDAQVDVLVEVGGEALEVGVGALHLLVETGDVGREEPLDAQLPALLRGEGGALVQQRHPRQHQPGEVGRQVGVAVLVGEAFVLLHALLLPSALGGV
ncbi:MAG: hypothetical protein P8Y02_07090, partial [Deinococcales bacterium]